MFPNITHDFLNIGHGHIDISTTQTVYYCKSLNLLVVRNSKSCAQNAPTNMAHFEEKKCLCCYLIKEGHLSYEPKLTSQI